MLSKVLRRWWLVVLVMAIGAAVSVARDSGFQGLYTGRTTLMATNGGSSAADLAEIGHGSRVAEGFTQAVRDFETLGDPEQVLGNTRVMPIEGTSIVKVEVTMRDAGSAKMAADVYAASLKNVYARMKSPESSGSVNQERYIKTVDPAYVFPVSTPRCRGVARGLLAGLAIGVAIAAALPPLKERGIAQQTDSSTQ